MRIERACLAGVAASVLAPRTLQAQAAAPADAHNGAPGVAGAADPLAALRDIQLPDAPSWWPPAPGWWLLLALALLLLLLAFRAWQRWYARRRPWRAARAGLAQVRLRAAQPDASPLLLAEELSTVIRRYALTLWPRTQVARLAGESWRQFLVASGGSAFQGAAGELIATQRYRRPVDEGAHAAAGAHAQALSDALDAARAWVDLHRPGNRPAGTPPSAGHADA